ncbi:39S ribosomal protein L33, mitochondrial [Bombus pyrosoma]|uniref:39S ribosomal protein L33, mitochondrial n=1 Tax=Bombus pyrosoma TaxID=396416 RepID=UPI001CB9A0B5|nr:39S ribosomal protein L33, mitochondrial [Bombus pyrosoma]
MFLTNVLLKKVKSKHILVLVESVASGHKYIRIRDRLADKLEGVWFDPYVREHVLYRELKKVKSL